MEAIAEKGAETAVAVAGGRAVKSAVQGRFKKALIWSIPVAFGGCGYLVHEKTIGRLDH